MPQVERPILLRIREIWMNGFWLAVVDDEPGWARTVTDAIKLGLGEDINAKLPFHEFTSLGEFWRRARDYNMCILDARFDDERMTGPQVAARLRCLYPQLIIVGSSSEPKLNQAFAKVSADLVIPKKELIDRIPEIINLAGRPGNTF